MKELVIGGILAATVAGGVFVYDGTDNNNNLYNVDISEARSHLSNINNFNGKPPFSGSSISFEKLSEDHFRWTATSRSGPIACEAVLKEISEDQVSVTTHCNESEEIDGIRTVSVAGFNSAGFSELISSTLEGRTYDNSISEAASLKNITGHPTKTLQQMTNMQQDMNKKTKGYLEQAQEMHEQNEEAMEEIISEMHDKVAKNQNKNGNDFLSDTQNESDF